MPGTLVAKCVVDDDAAAVVQLRRRPRRGRDLRCRAAADGDEHARRPRSSSASPPAAGSTVTCAAAGVLRRRSPWCRAGTSMPCLPRMRWNCLATSPSMPGRMRSRNSITVTLEPRRARPSRAPGRCTPPPTRRCACGTSASVERPGRGDDRASRRWRRPAGGATSEPVAMTIALASSTWRAVPSAGDLDLARRRAIVPVPWIRRRSCSS